MISKKIEEIIVDDINDLLRNGIPESKSIEYKRDLPSELDSSKIAFLAEVSAFGNTIGGDLVIGIEDDKGVPKSINGVQIIDVDQEILRLENIIRNGLEPRLVGIGIRIIIISSDNYVIVIRVPRSWQAPHRVNFKDHGKFYGSNSSGKYPLDVSELRNAFNFSSQIIDRIKSFISDRTYSLEFGEFQTINIAKGGTLVLHCIPLSSFSSNANIDIRDLMANRVHLSPLGVSGWNHKLNLEGLINYSTSPQGPSRSYTQIYRNGIIESGVIISTNAEERKLLPILWCERILIEAVENAVKFYNKVEIEPPGFIFLTLLKFKGFALGIGSSYFDSGELLDRDHTSIPEITLTSYSENIGDQLKSIFDILWNSFGYEKSRHYDDNGHWVGKA